MRLAVRACAFVLGAGTLALGGCLGGSGQADEGAATPSPPLITGEPGSPSSEPSGTGTESETETETGQTETTTETEPPPTPIAGPCCLGAALEAGTYATPPWFGIPLSVSLPDGWSGVAGQRRKLVLLGKGKTGDDELARVMAFFVVETPKRFEQALRSTPGLRVGDSEGSQLGGQPARVFGAGGTTGATVAIPAIADLGPGTWSTRSADARLAFVLVDTGDTSLLVYVEAPRERFQQFLENVRSVLATLAFG